MVRLLFDSEAEGVDDFDYFMIRIRRAPSEGTDPVIAGTVERIGTSQKRIFATGSELLRILAPVASLLDNMPSDDHTGKKESEYPADWEDGVLRSAATEEPRTRSDSDSHLEP